MNQAETAKLSELLEQWNDADEFSRCIEAIEAIPEQERGYFLTVKLSRAYSNLAVLGDHRAHGTDGAVDGALIRHAIDLLESVCTQGENDPYWNARMGYSCLMAYPSAATAYEYAKHWLDLAPEDPNAQKLVRDCEEYLEEEKALECPTVRGSVMNPNDHPHGGGEGKTSIGRPGPCTPWGKPALGLKTRKKNKQSNKLIVRRRNGKQ